MKKVFLYFILIVSAIFFLSSCKSSTNNDGVKGDVTIVFSTFVEGECADAYKEIINNFEETHKNIKVNFQSDARGYDDNIKDAFEKDKAPDIIGLQRTKMIDYVKQGYIKDITDWINSQGLKDKYYGVNLGYGKYDGKYYGIGDMPYTLEWYYNTDLFKKAGLNQPKDINELINACNKLKRFTQNPIIIGAKDPWAIDTFFGAITVQAVNTDELSKAYGNGNKDSYASLAGMDDSINVLNNLIKSGAINSKSEDYDYAYSISEFVKGRAAILPMGSWAIQKIEKEKPKGFNYEVFDEPIRFFPNADSYISATAVQVITVNAKSRHLNESMEFLNYLFSEDAQRIFAKYNGISGYKILNSANTETIKDKVLKHLEMTDENSTMYIDNVSEKMAEVTGNRLLQLVTSKIKAKDVWSLIVDESILSSNK